MSVFDQILEAGKTFLSPIFNIIDQLISDKDLNAKLKFELESKWNEYQNAQKIKILQNEVDIDSAFYRNWRPLSGYVVCAIVGLYGIWNYLFFPIFTMIKTGTVVQLTMDLDFIALLGSISGLYTIARTVEKTKSKK